MIRIALCDDNKEDMLQLHQKIIEWYRENSKNQSVSITEYSDSVYLSSVIVQVIHMMFFSLMLKCQKLMVFSLQIK